MIAEKTPYAAVTKYQRQIHRLVSRVTLSHVKVAGGYQLNESRPQRMELDEGNPVKLSGPHDLLLKVQSYFQVRRINGQGDPYHVELAGYHYIVSNSEGREVIAYHWHPRGSIQTPHVHLGSGAQIGFDPLVSKAHLPTGHITLGEIIRFLIRDLSVKPFYDDWEATVEGILEPAVS